MANTHTNTKQLAADIRKTADRGEPVETNLATSQRIIARVTDGIYREPWAAFRELIANAYDADATEVVVETGAPEFEKIVVRDNGLGMSPDTLAYVVKNIGGSSKRTDQGVELQTVKKGKLDESIGGRPLIGKIGIGLFAVAQLTQHFQIITKSKGDKFRTSATVLLKTHFEDDLENMKADDEYVAGTVSIISERVTDDDINAHGTSVTLYSLRPEVRKILQSVGIWNASMSEGVDGEPVQQPPQFHIGVLGGVLGKASEPIAAELPWDASASSEDKFAALIRAAGAEAGRSTKQANLDHLDEYLKTIWKLSLSLPLEYLGTHPFDLTGASGIKFYGVPDGRGQAKVIKLAKSKSLRDQLGLTAGNARKKLDFRVRIDDITIKHPIDLPTDLVAESRVGTPVMMVSSEKAPFSKKDIERAGGELEFEAYLYWNSKIIPKDTAGVMVRVRGASGTLFDQRFLNYQVSEQTRLRQITAEIFVKKGLDGAINIDRESFNYSHPHYLYIQRWLHKALRLLVNRLKALAKEDLDREKTEAAAGIQKAKQKRALSVWERRQGDTADPPLRRNRNEALPVESVGGVDIEWPARPKLPSQEQTDTEAALAVVLEAYGVLSGLNKRDRARLIQDIIAVFEIDQ